MVAGSSRIVAESGRACCRNLTMAAMTSAEMVGAHPMMRGSSRSSMLAPLSCDLMTLPTTTSPSFSVCPIAGSGACWLSGAQWPRALPFLCRAQLKGWDTGWDGSI